MKQYSILLEKDPESGTYTVTVLSLPGVVTQGHDLEDAIAMAKDAIRCHIEGLLKDGLPVPEEDERPQSITIDVAAYLPPYSLLPLYERREDASWGSQCLAQT